MVEGCQGLPLETIKPAHFKFSEGRAIHALDSMTSIKSLQNRPAEKERFCSSTLQFPLTCVMTANVGSQCGYKDSHLKEIIADYSRFNMSAGAQQL